MKTLWGKLLGVGVGLLASGLSAQPVITNQPANQTVIYGGNATFSVMATGVGPLTYQWQLNGTNLPNNIISTVAGGNLFNNLPATNTILAIPVGVSQDSVGNIYIADTGNSVIRKVDTNGMAMIIAGNGSSAFSGDGGAATNATLNAPNAVILDTVGNLLIADTGNYRIRKVDTNGVISTIAGSGSAFPLGDNGQATNAGFNSPVGICLDGSGNLFIADQFGNRIRKVATSGIISTVVGSSGVAGYSSDGGTATFAQLSSPSGVVVDSLNNLYIADYGNNRIRKVANNVITTVVGTGTAGYSGDGGAATSATIRSPAGVALDAFRNLYVADSGNSCIRKITNNIITTLAGNGTNGFSGDGGLATNAILSKPPGVSVDSLGGLLIADFGNNRIRKMASNGSISTVVGRFLNDGDWATNATLNRPNGTALDSLGNLYIADYYNNRVRKVGTNGIITTVAGTGLSAYSGDGGFATNAGLYFPSSVALDAVGNLFIADSRNFRVRKVDTSGIIMTIAGNGTNGYAGDGGTATNAKIGSVYGLAVDAAGNCFIADGNRVRKVDTNGYISTVAGNGSFGFSGDGGAAISATLGLPYSLSLDSVGNIFIADTANVRIREVNTNGIISTVAGNGKAANSGDGGQATNASFITPYAVTADSFGRLLIIDVNTSRLRIVGTNGIITTVAGNGGAGFSGDGSSAGNASLSFPHGVVLDVAGNVYVTDTGNNRIRKLSDFEFSDQPSFTLTNVASANMSNNYSVIITSASGSVTSSVVSVNVQLPPITPTFTASNGICQFSWSAVSNLTYQLQSATNLIAANWQDLGSPITATNNAVSATNAAGADGQRFYRVRLWP